MAKPKKPEPSPPPTAQTFENLERRQEVHASRLLPLDQLLAELTTVRETAEKERKRLRESISQLDAERKGLAAQVERLKQEKERLEKEDEAFAQEHLRHDAALKERIEKANQLAKDILALVKS